MGEYRSGVEWMAAEHPAVFEVWQRQMEREAGFDRALIAFLGRYDPASSDWAHETETVDA